MDGTKVLADHEIENAIARGELVLNADPEGCVGACYELRMGDVYYDLTEGEKRFAVDPGGTVLIKPGHRVILITHEKLELDDKTFARVVSKGSLFSIGLSPVATYADPGFRGRLGIVTQNISDKYIELPLLEHIAKVDFTILEIPAKRTYHGQHGFESKIWPFRHELQKTREQLSGDPRLGAPTEVAPPSGTSGAVSLASLTRRQIDADRKHGFPVDLTSDEDRCRQLSKDLVGLMGEIGEFANLVKKVELAISRRGYAGPKLGTATPDLRMELADAQIYMLRLAHLIRVDLGEAVLEKMRVNDERYGYLKEG